MLKQHGETGHSTASSSDDRSRARASVPPGTESRNGCPKSCTVRRAKTAADRAGLSRSGRALVLVRYVSSLRLPHGPHLGEKRPLDHPLRRRSLCTHCLRHLHGCVLFPRVGAPFRDGGSRAERGILTPVTPRQALGGAQVSSNTLIGPAVDDRRPGRHERRDGCAAVSVPS
jgi:hypothetical protein